MEEAKAVAKYIRIAPRKLRIVINLIRGKSVNEALQSSNSPRRLVLRLLKRFCVPLLPMLDIIST